MTTEQMILDRLDRLETQIAPLAASAKALGELREELAPRVNEAVQALIVELADVEADFQIKDCKGDAEGVLTECRLCGRLHCSDCVDEYGRCVECAEKKTS
jgi:hypothetical protein